MSSVATVQARPQKESSKARKPYTKPLVEELVGKRHSQLAIDERTRTEFKNRVAECRSGKDLIKYRIEKKLDEAKIVGLDYDDLEQAAFDGILLAMRTYDPESSEFRTWAGHKIRGEITKTLNDAYRLRGTHNRYIWIVRGYDEALRIHNGLQKSLPRTGFGFEVLEELRCGKKTEEQVKEKRRAAILKLNRRRGCFLDDRIRSKSNDTGDDLTVMNKVENKIAEEWEEPDIEGEELKDKLKAAVWESLNVLNDREKHLITRRHLEGEATLQKLGDEWGVSRERVRQIEVNAFRKLREILYDDPLVKYNIHPELL